MSTLLRISNRYNNIAYYRIPHDFFFGSVCIRQTMVYRIHTHLHTNTNYCYFKPTLNVHIVYKNLLYLTYDAVCQMCQVKAKVQRIEITGENVTLQFLAFICKYSAR